MLKHRNEKQTTVGLVRCVPIAAFWDPSVHGQCLVNEVKIIWATMMSHIALNVAIVLLPIWRLRKLYLEFWPRIGVIMLFLLGIM